MKQRFPRFFMCFSKIIFLTSGTGNLPETKNNIIMKKIVLLSFVVLLCSYATAQFEKKDYAKVLRKDLVEVTENQYIFSTYYLMKDSKNFENTQFKLFSTAPKTVISRDKFVMYTTQLFTMVIVGSILSSTENFDLNNELDNEIKMIEMDEPIGEVDLSLSITMTENGLQMIILSTEGKEHITMTWDDLLDD